MSKIKPEDHPDYVGGWVWTKLELDWINERIGTDGLTICQAHPSQRREQMNIFIDGEWNSYGGDLISLALVAEDGRSFYEVLGCDNPDPWVAENVMPKLGKEPIPLVIFQLELAKYLMQFEFDSVHIIADWPEDIMWFCKVLVIGPGTRLDTPPLTMEVLRVDTVSKNPHNALADAEALRDWYVNVNMNSIGSNT
jgi:uncharacterized protein (DUF169 family)